MSYTYRAYGLTIRVPFPCQALVPVNTRGPDGGDGEPDVLVRPGPVPRRLSSPRAAEPGWDAGPGTFLLRGGRRAGRFLVEAGTVTFERNPDCDDAELARWFTHHVLPAMLRQRGLLVLHANAVAVPGGAIVIGGESGAGKSTTTAALLNAGCRMMSDDLTALRPGPVPGTVEVVPGVPQVHLAEDAAQDLGYRVDPAQLQPWRRMKAAIPALASMTRSARRLRALYLLRLSGGDDVVVTGIGGGDKFRMLQDCLYGPMFTEEHPALFPLLSMVVATVPFFRLERPGGRWSIDEVATAILGVPVLDAGAGPSR
jgi:hypothetical protein